MAVFAEPETHKNETTGERYCDYNPRAPTPDTHSEDLYKLYKDALDIYILLETFELEQLHNLKKQTEHPNQQSKSATRIDGWQDNQQKR